MTKEECVKIMAMLGAFYSGGKNDPKAQANAWYLILGKYPYHIAEAAVLHYAEHDIREYATFPTVGSIVTEIQNVQLRMDRPVQEIIRAIAYGRDYMQLTDGAKELISKDAYNEWLGMDAEEFASKTHILSDILKGNQQKYLESGNGKNKQPR